MTKIKFNKQFLLVKFPIIFPLIYGFILYSFPSFETALIILTILLLAETHFAATWPFFLDKVNYPFIIKNRASLITMPVFIILFSLFGFFLFNKLFLLIFFAANMHHVTRQSFGIAKLYCKNIEENKFQEIFIYLINIIFFIIGFFRFYIPFIDQSNLFYLNFFIFLFLILISFYYVFKFGYSDNFFVFLTGCLIFLPMCFVNNPIHAIIMGVTMHYTQYLFLTYNVCNSRSNNTSRINSPTFNKKVPKYLLTVLIYAMLMTIFSILGKYDGVYLKQLIIIPIIGQMLHFYLDSQLWKFSDKHNRDNTLSYITKIIK